MNKILLTAIIGLLFYFPVSGQQKFKEITLEDITRNYTFYARGVSGLRPMKDGIHYSTVDYQKNLILKHSYQTGQVTDTLLKLVGLKLVNFSDYELSNDESKVLLETNSKSIYRRSFTADYFIYDLKSSQLIPVSERKDQQLATFSPDGTKVAFVCEDNIYIKDINSGKEITVTTDGLKNSIINGAPDWVYEEEFEFNKAFDWSPDSKKLAFIRFDESKVKTFDMTVYSGMAPKIEQNKLYPENRQWKYPKAGEDNSVVSVLIYNLSNNQTVKADVGKETDIYIPRIKWTKDPGKLSILKLNRLQNKLEILLAEADKGSTSAIYTEENKYYIDETLFDDINFLNDGKQFVMTSEKDGYKHIYICSLDGKSQKLVTKGNWDVADFIGYDETNKLFYYTSFETSPVTKDLYVVDLAGKQKKKLTTTEGVNNCSFSANYKYFINTVSNINLPTYVTLHDSKGNLIRVLKDNKALADKVKEYGGINKTFFTFKTTEDTLLYGIMTKPADFDPNKKYPVLLYQYSGPNSQQVVNRWSFGWSELLAQKGYIIVTVDGRGTGARGENFRKMTYLQLGKYETIDQIETAKYLATLPYVDKDRIGIWGWSFGGFETLLAMTKGADYFKAGIAVAPVTNWRYYDNIYTERFMRKPQDNPSGYDDNSPINHAAKLKGKLLLVHGTADDNVHVQNSMEMSEALVQANKQFQVFYYTNRNHGIYGGNTSLHLYTMLTDFILKNL
ncbi:MAG: S9 family peptidase [Bacteroidales bacterium]